MLSTISNLLNTTDKKIDEFCTKAFYHTHNYEDISNLTHETFHIAQYLYTERNYDLKNIQSILQDKLITQARTSIEQDKNAPAMYSPYLEEGSKLYFKKLSQKKSTDFSYFDQEKFSQRTLAKENYNLAQQRSYTSIKSCLTNYLGAVLSLNVTEEEYVFHQKNKSKYLSINTEIGENIKTAKKNVDELFSN